MYRAKIKYILRVLFYSRYEYNDLNVDIGVNLIDITQLRPETFQNMKKKDLGNYTVSGIDLQIIATRTDN